MTTVGDIFHWMDEIAPFSTAMDFDNVGLLVGDEAQPVTRVLLTLDITSSVAEEARAAGAQLILSHHPVIFQPLRRLPAGSVPYLLARYGISAICSHTNLDMAQEGVNTMLAQTLGLKQLRPLREYAAAARWEAVIGVLPNPLEPGAFAALVKDKLGLACCGYVPGNCPVSRVALCSGAGGDYLEDAARGGADAFVTGEAKHHQLLFAKERGITLVPAGHYATENGIVELLSQRLKERFPGVAFIPAKTNLDPITYC